MTKAICTVDGCSGKHKAHGYCVKHYERFLHHGSPTGGRAYDGEPQKFFDEVVLSYSGDECLIWPFAKTKKKGGPGYGYLYSRNKGTKVVPRLVCEHFNGPPPTKFHQARHLCGNGNLGCCTPRHLAWGTALQNAQDKILHGTSGRGEKHPGAKLAESDVLKIRRLLGEVTNRHIARTFDVSPALIHSIARRKLWEWMEDREGVVLIDGDVAELLRAYAARKSIGLDHAADQLLLGALGTA